MAQQYLIVFIIVTINNSPVQLTINYHYYHSLYLALYNSTWPLKENQPVTTLTAAQRSHFSVLCVNLRDVSQPAAQHIRRDVITKLVFPFSCLDTSPVHLGAAVSWAGHRRVQWLNALIWNKANVEHKALDSGPKWMFIILHYLVKLFLLVVVQTIVASHDTANARGKFKHVGDGGRVQQLVLWREDRSKCHTHTDPGWHGASTSPEPVERLFQGLFFLQWDGATQWSRKTINPKLWLFFAVTVEKGRWWSLCCAWMR